MSEAHPRDRFITVYGRQAVLEALADESLVVDKVVLADNARGAPASAIVDAAKRRGVRLDRRPPAAVSRISRNGRQDQGVVADVEAPAMGPLDAEALDRPALLLDGVTNPQNVGMVIRTATAAGFAVVLPRQGVPDIGPLVIKASAGVAFRARILRVESAALAADALTAAGHRLLGLRSVDAPALDDVDLGAAGVEGPGVVFVLGSESTGVSQDVAAFVHEWVAIPMEGGVESLNVASAAAVVCFELARRKRAAAADSGSPAAP